MHRRSHSRSFSGQYAWPGLSLILFGILLGTLFVAGGSVRDDALGQAVVRGVAWLLLIVAILFGKRPDWRRVTPVVMLLAAATLLVLLQLVPLPPAIWQGLPGRTILAEAVIGTGPGQPWRPWTMTPGATINALSSLVVPVASVVFMAGLRDTDRVWLPRILLGLICASTLIGLLQFSGAAVGNPFINDSDGQVSGSFANRNHFALFVAFGCLLAPVWPFLGGRSGGWRAPMALALVLLFALIILGSGSRAGLVLGVTGLMIGMALARQELQAALANRPRWLLPVAIAGVLPPLRCLC